MRSISITVAGQNFKIRSDADDQYLHDLAKEVTKRFSAISKDGSRRDQEFKAMAMVAIALLDELNTMNGKYKSVQTKAKHFATQMIDRIDALLSTETS